MSSFKDFVKSNAGSNFLPSVKDQELAISTKLTGALPVNQRNKFSSVLSKLVQEDSFIDELSDSIGKPKENESEDEFVERAKDALRYLLDRKLSK
jgi:hypothetical protein